MVATRGRTFKRPWRRSCHSSKLKSSSAPIGRKDSWCFHAVGSSNAPLLGSTAAEGLQRIGRTSIATRWRSCGLPQSASCSENFVIPPDVFGQTLRLDKKCVPIVGLLDFARKVEDLVRVNAVMQAKRKDKDFVNDVCNRAHTVNGRRRIVAHASFKPARDGGVLFSRAVTAKGSVLPLSQPWSDEDFATLYADMTALEADLDKVIDRIKPVPEESVITWLSALS